MSAYIVEILRVADGELVSTEMDGCETDVEYLWSEGNYSCDCNREIIFRRARSEEFQSLLSGGGCGEGRFKVRITADTGDVPYDEINSAAAQGGGEVVKFYELKRGQPFRFVETVPGDQRMWYSLGVDGAYGRYSKSPHDWHNVLHCKPLDEVQQAVEDLAQQEAREKYEWKG